jgi:hypothetical protein
MLYTAPTVNKQPKAVLVDYTIFYIPELDEYHLAGNLSDTQARVTSKIKAVHVGSLNQDGPKEQSTLFETNSGRMYEVVGRLDVTFLTKNSNYVLGEWLRYNGLKYEKIIFKTYDDLYNAFNSVNSTNKLKS